MKSLKNRPALICALLYICSLYLSHYLTHTEKTAAIALSLLFLIAVIIFSVFNKRPFLKIAAAALSVAVAFAVSIGYFDIKLESIRSLDTHTAFVQGEILREKNILSYQSTYEVRIKNAKGCRYSFKSELTLPAGVTLNEGDLFEGNVTFTQFAEERNGTPERMYKESKGFIIASSAESITVTGRSGSLSSFFRKINRSFASIFGRALNAESAAFVECVLLGSKDEASPTLNRDFANLGISHMLAISGMHLSIILGLLYLLLTALTIDKKIKNAILIASALFIMLITGMSVSVVRAGIMVIICYLCFYLGRSYDAPTSLCVSCALICLVNPSSIYDAGLILSFTATLAIVTVGEKIRYAVYGMNIPKKLKKYIVALLIAIAVSFTLIPVTYIYFGKISAVSPICTLLFTPVLTLVLYLSILLLLLFKVPLISGIIVFLLENTIRISLSAVSGIASHGVYLLSLDYPFVKYIIISFIFIIAVLFILSPKKSAWYVLPAAFFIAAYSVCSVVYHIQNSDKVFISVTSSGISDVISFTAKGKSTIVDITDGYYSPLYTACANTQSGDCVTHFSSYVIVNYHNRNTSSLSRLLSRQYVDTVYLPSPGEEEREIYDALSEIAAENGVSVKTYEYGKETEIDGVSLCVDPPEYISRSARPINKININGDVTYIGAAYSETGKTPEGKTVICGNYGPKYKNEFSYENQTVYLSSSASDFYAGNGANEYDEFIKVIINSD